MLVDETPPACPVCGAPEGRCVVRHMDGQAVVKTIDWRDANAEADRDRRTMAEGDVVASERIWEDVPVPRSTRTRRVLRYRPGTVIPAEAAIRLNVAADGRQTGVPVAPVDESGAVVPLPATWPRNLETK